MISRAVTAGRGQGETEEQMVLSFVKTFNSGQQKGHEAKIAMPYMQSGVNDHTKGVAMMALQRYESLGKFIIAVAKLFPQ